jgi:broad specificity phosphatase PhoE
VVNPTYAEIIVVRHGETEWNHDGRIQVLPFLSNIDLFRIHLLDFETTSFCLSVMI